MGSKSDYLRSEKPIVTSKKYLPHTYIHVCGYICICVWTCVCVYTHTFRWLSSLSQSACMSAVMETRCTSVRAVQKSSPANQATECWHPSTTGWTNRPSGREDESQAGEVNSGKEKQGFLSSFSLYMVLSMDFWRENDPENTNKEKKLCSHIFPNSATWISQGILIDASLPLFCK